jgi:hypothetical protein
MPPAAEGTMELDLTIHANVLPAPSHRFTGIEIGSNDSQLGFQDPGRCAVSVTNICDTTSSWDCTSPWVCG